MYTYVTQILWCASSCHPPLPRIVPVVHFTVPGILIDSWGGGAPCRTLKHADSSRSQFLNKQKVNRSTVETEAPIKALPGGTRCEMFGGWLKTGQLFELFRDV